MVRFLAGAKARTDSPLFLPMMSDSLLNWQHSVSTPGCHNGNEYVTYYYWVILVVTVNS